MSVTIKLEKICNENPNNELPNTDYISIDSYSTLQCQNENLKLLLSISKKQCSDQELDIVNLTSQVKEMKQSMGNLKQEILMLKHENEKSSNIMKEKNMFLNILYNTIDNLESKNSPVTNPKSAVKKLNDYQQTTKELRDKVVDNKILIMTMCKVLGCIDTKIIQSLKNIISENEANKQKYKIYEQFYQNSVKMMNQMSSELHRNGYDKTVAIIDNNNTNKICSVHTESFNNWNMKIANIKSNSMSKCDKYNVQTPQIQQSLYTPIVKPQRYFHQLPENPNLSFQNNPCNQVDFYRTFPPPFSSPRPFGFISKPSPVMLSLPPIPPIIVNPIIQNGLLFKSNYQNKRRPRSKTKNLNAKSNNSSVDSEKSINQSSQSDCNSSNKFEINSNVFDWNNFESSEAKSELMKLEKKMLEASSSSGLSNLSPSLSLVEDGLEIWASDSDSDSIEPKRTKLRID